MRGTTATLTTIRLGVIDLAVAVALPLVGPLWDLALLAVGTAWGVGSLGVGTAGRVGFGVVVALGTGLSAACLPFLLVGTQAMGTGQSLCIDSSGHGVRNMEEIHDDIP